jgi:hypothetical protein
VCVYRLRYREKRKERREIYTIVVGRLVPYRLGALTSAQLKLSSVRSIVTCVESGLIFVSVGM